MSTLDGAPPAPEPAPRPSREHEVRELYYRHFGDHRRERQLFSMGSFFLTFGAVRTITHLVLA